MSTHAQNARRPIVGFLALAIAFGAFGAVPAESGAESRSESGAESGAEPKGDSYFDQMTDLPLMPGLREVPGAGVTFDKPGGRIVEAFAHGAVARAAVRRFYRETLPQLGWDRERRDAFVREGERLSLDYLGRDGDLTVRYTLAPA